MTPEQAARRLGMKLREVVAVTPVEGGHVVTNHVGNRTLIADSGELVFGVPTPVAQPAADVLAGVDDTAAVDVAPVLEVPAGPAESVLEWVGDDQARAVAALTVEQGKSKPRRTLVEQLGKLAGATHD